MTDSIGHRGPDDEGQLVEGNVGIGMRRLAIVDLSRLRAPAAVQRDRSVAVVFNGEIYNQRDLRSRLELDGHTFRGTSDTEVLVHGYEQFGAHGADPAPGGNVRVRAARSPRAGGCSWRATASASSRCTCGEPRRSSRSPRRCARSRTTAAGPLSIDPSFTHTFLRLGYVPSPGSAFAGIEKLAPGTLQEIDLRDRRHANRDVLPSRARGASTTCAPTRCWNGCASCSTAPCAAT